MGKDKKIKHRDWNSVAAKFRNSAGAMKNKEEKRKSNKKRSEMDTLMRDANEENREYEAEYPIIQSLCKSGHYLEHQYKETIADIIKIFMQRCGRCGEKTIWIHVAKNYLEEIELEPHCHSEMGTQYKIPKGD